LRGDLDNPIPISASIPDIVLGGLQAYTTQGIPAHPMEIGFGPVYNGASRADHVVVAFGFGFPNKGGGQDFGIGELREIIHLTHHHTKLSNATP